MSFPWNRFRCGVALKKTQNLRAIPRPEGLIELFRSVDAKEPETVDACDDEAGCSPPANMKLVLEHEIRGCRHESPCPKRALPLHLLQLVVSSHLLLVQREVRIDSFLGRKALRTLGLAISPPLRSRVIPSVRITPPMSRAGHQTETWIPICHRVGSIGLLGSTSRGVQNGSNTKNRS